MCRHPPANQKGKIRIKEEGKKRILSGTFTLFTDRFTVILLQIEWGEKRKKEEG